MGNLLKHLKSNLVTSVGSMFRQMTCLLDRVLDDIMSGDSLNQDLIGHCVGQVLSLFLQVLVQTGFNITRPHYVQNGVFNRENVPVNFTAGCRSGFKKAGPLHDVSSERPRTHPRAAVTTIFRKQIPLIFRALLTRDQSTRTPARKSLPTEPEIQTRRTNYNCHFEIWKQRHGTNSPLQHSRDGIYKNNLLDK